MRKYLLAAAAAMLGSMVLPAAASAAQAVTNSWAALRAGPNWAYPAIARTGPGIQIAVFGCLPNYTWCDSAVGGDRGWLPRSQLNFIYLGRPVGLPVYAAAVGLPLVTFNFADYWGRWYVGRPWYYDRGYWGRWGRGYRPPPPPAGWHPWHPNWDHHEAMRAGVVHQQRAQIGFQHQQIVRQRVQIAHQRQRIVHDQRRLNQERRGDHRDRFHH